MRDGIGQVGAGQDDMRMAGSDLQHNAQLGVGDEYHSPVRRVKHGFEDGGPMKPDLQGMLKDEAERHALGKHVQLKHLIDHTMR